MHVRNKPVLALVVVVAALTGTASTAVQQAQPAAYTPTNIDEVLKAVRYDLQSQRADVMAKNLTLDASQAAKFWPLYKQYEAAGKALNDKRFDLITKYIDAGDKADAAMATNVVKASLQRDIDVAKLRVEYAPKFAKVLPKAKAARVLQVDRALSLMIDAKLASMVPLLPWYPWPPLEE